MDTYSQSKSERTSAKERKEHRFIPANSRSHSNSKSSTQSNISAAVKMSQNPSNTAYWTQHAEGEPTDPSTYPQQLPNLQSDSISGSSGSQLAQTSASNPSHQQSNNNQGGNAASGGQLAAYQAQTQQQEPFSNLAGQYRNPRGGLQAEGSAAGSGQGGTQGGGHGSGNTEAGRGGYQNGYAPSTSATWGSSSSGRSSGGQA